MCGDDVDTATATSYSKRNRLSQLNSQQNQGTCAGSSTNPPETDQLILGDSTKDVKNDDSVVNVQPIQPNKSSLNTNQPIVCDTTSQANTSDTTNTQMKNMSKAAVLRHLFFSQISSNGNTAEPTSNLASSKETN